MTVRAGTGRALLVYNAARLLLFGAATGALFLVGLRGWPLVFAALLVSGVVSWFLLGRQRMAIGEAVERSVRRARLRIDDRAAAEDQALEQVHDERQQVR